MHCSRTFLRSVLLYAFLLVGAVSFLSLFTPPFPNLMCPKALSGLHCNTPQDVPPLFRKYETSAVGAHIVRRWYAAVTIISEHRAMQVLQVNIGVQRCGYIYR